MHVNWCESNYTVRSSGVETSLIWIKPVRSSGVETRLNPMKHYYVYILQCSDGLIYTGMTNNISGRIDEHQRGLNKSCFTYKRRPVKFLFHQEFNDVEQAIFFEKRIKNWSGRKKLALANGDFDLLKLLAQFRNETHARNSVQKVGLDSARPDNSDKA